MEKTKQTVQVLTIEKLVKLLSPYHFDVFVKYLKDSNAQLPLKLVNQVNKDLYLYQGNEELCELVYGRADKQTRQSFNQLASYTLKLTSYLARNYPAYLSHNVDKLEILINEGKVEQALVLAEMLSDIAEKIEDYKVLVNVLAFLSQYHFLTNGHGEGLRLQSKIGTILGYEKDLNDIIYYFKTNINVSVRDNNPGEYVDNHLAYFEKYITSPSFSVATMAKFYSLYINYYYNTVFFYSPPTQIKLEELEEDLVKYGYVILPFFTDLHSKLAQFKLNRPDLDLAGKDSKKEIEKLLKYNQYYLYWKHFSQQPELYVINIKATYYLANYHYVLHRPDSVANIPTADFEEIKYWTAQAEEKHKNINWTRENILELIHLRLNFSALLLLGPIEKRRQAIDLIEETLISYQQLSFSESIDSFYICLMIGYFSVKDYERCVATYKRYIKLTQGRKINEDNDISIHAYYYAAQWILTGRKQYPEKLFNCYKQTAGNDFYKTTRKTIIDLIETCNIPVAV